MADLYTTEFFNSVKNFGLSYHELKLKIKAPVMIILELHIGKEKL